LVVQVTTPAHPSIGVQSREGKEGEGRREKGEGRRVEWSGVEWSGVEWSGVEWSGVERRKQGRGREEGKGREEGVGEWNGREGESREGQEASAIGRGKRRTHPCKYSGGR
jgi:hypothetical protein